MVDEFGLGFGRDLSVEPGQTLPSIFGVVAIGQSHDVPDERCLCCRGGGAQGLGTVLGEIAFGEQRAAERQGIECGEGDLIAPESLDDDVSLEVSVNAHCLVLSRRKVGEWPVTYVMQSSMK